MIWRHRHHQNFGTYQSKYTIGTLRNHEYSRRTKLCTSQGTWVCGATTLSEWHAFPLWWFNLLIANYMSINPFVESLAQALTGLR